MPKAVFLDRDGVLNHNVFYADSGEWESPRAPGEFRLIEGAISALLRLQAAGYLLFIVTNQPSHAKGKTPLAALKETLSLCESLLAAGGVKIEKTYCSFHHPQSLVPELAAPCPYRKPSPQALLDAIRDFTLDPAACWMIGDRATDTQCAEAAGVRGIRVAPDYAPEILPEDPSAFHICRDLQEAADFVLK